MLPGSLGAMTSGTSGRDLSVEIQPVVSGVRLERARVLLAEYLCLPLEGTQRSQPWRTEELGEALRDELATLPGRYKAPHGRLTIGVLDGNPVGCGAVSVHHRVAELKRLYVRREARSRGIGRALVEDAIDWARSFGCRQLRLDVWLERKPAIRLYQSLGFQPIEPYETYPFDMVFMGLPLTRNET